MPPTGAIDPPGTDVRELLQVLLRRRWLILAPVMLGLACAWLVHSQLTPRYAAEATILLSLRTTKIVDTSEVVSSLPREQAAVRTEMELLRSRSMAERVVDRLRLVDDPTFPDRHYPERPLPILLAEVQEQVAAWLARLRSEAPPEAAPGPDDYRQSLVDVVESGVLVNNDGQSFTLHVRFVSPDPEIAAAVANGYAEAYLDYQREIKSQGTREASRWLGVRIEELRAELERAESAAEGFRRRVGVLAPGGPSAAQQEVVELTRQLTGAELEQRRIDTRVAVLREAIRAGRLDASPETMSSGVIAALRQQQAAARAQEAELLGTYGRRHPALVKARSDRLTVEQEIAKEANRIALSLEQEASTAAVRVAGLREDLAAATARMNAAENSEVKLAQLEREAKAGRELYNSYLLRMKQLGEQEQLQTPDAVIITAAQVPWKTYPNRFSTLLLGLFAGGIVGALLGFVRERLDDSLRSTAEVERLTGLPVLGLVPNATRWRQRPEEHLLRQPHSAYAEAVRTTGLIVTLSDEQRPTKVIAVTSAQPGEGKTTFCISVARQMALEGRRVLLVDADLRRPRVVAAMGAEAGPDLLDVLRGESGYEAAVQVDARSGAHYLGARSGVARPLPLLESPAMQSLLARVGQGYDVVLIDTPPMTVATDTAIVARAADACLFFVRWGVTSREAVLHGLRVLSLCRVRCMGVVISRVELRRFHGYSAHPSYTPAVG